MASSGNTARSQPWSSASPEGGQHPVDVAVEVADRGVDLAQGDTQAGHGVRVPAVGGRRRRPAPPQPRGRLAAWTEWWPPPRSTSWSSTAPIRVRSATRSTGWAARPASASPPSRPSPPRSSPSWPPAAAARACSRPTRPRSTSWPTSTPRPSPPARGGRRRRRRRARPGQAARPPADRRPRPPRARRPRADHGRPRRRGDRGVGQLGPPRRRRGAGRRRHGQARRPRAQLRERRRRRVRRRRPPPGPGGDGPRPPLLPGGRQPAARGPRRRPHPLGRRATGRTGSGGPSPGSSRRCSRPCPWPAIPRWGEPGPTPPRPRCGGGGGRPTTCARCGPCATGRRPSCAARAHPSARSSAARAASVTSSSRCRPSSSCTAAPIPSCARPPRSPPWPRWPAAGTSPRTTPTGCRRPTGSCAGSSTPCRSRTTSRSTPCPPTATSGAASPACSATGAAPTPVRPRRSTATWPATGTSSAASTSASTSARCSTRSAGAGRLSPEAAAGALASFGFADAERTRAAVRELTRGLTRTSRMMQQLLPLLLDWLSVVARSRPRPARPAQAGRRRSTGDRAGPRLPGQPRRRPEALRAAGHERPAGRRAGRQPRPDPPPRRPGPAADARPRRAGGLGRQHAVVAVGPRRAAAGAAALARAPPAGRGRPRRVRPGRRRHGRTRPHRPGRGLRRDRARRRSTRRSRSRSWRSGGSPGASCPTPATSTCCSSTTSGRRGRRARLADHDEGLRVAGGVLRFLAGSTPAHRIYAIDATLRPEGRQGALARSLDGYRAYLDRWAETWERQALARARPVAGDPELGQRFLDLLAEAVWDRPAHRGARARDPPDEGPHRARAHPAGRGPRVPPQARAGARCRTSSGPCSCSSSAPGSGCRRRWARSTPSRPTGPWPAPTPRCCGRPTGSASRPGTAGGSWARRPTAPDSLPVRPDDLLHLARSLGTTPSALREDYRRVDPPGPAGGRAPVLRRRLTRPTGDVARVTRDCDDDAHVSERWRGTCRSRPRSVRSSTSSRPRGRPPASS